MTQLITSMKVGTTTTTSSCRARGDYDLTRHIEAHRVRLEPPAGQSGPAPSLPPEGEEPESH
jgi:hypothetical protein